MNLNNEDDSDWQRLRFLPLPQVLKEFQDELGYKKEQEKTYSELKKHRCIAECKQTLTMLEMEAKGFLHSITKNPKVM